MDTFQPIGAVAVNVVARRRKALFKNANRAINFCARSIAKNVIKQQLRDQGRRMSQVPNREIADRAEVYLAAHPELFEQALQRAKQLGYIQMLPIMVTPDPSAERNSQ
jgi:hypothetical protein